MSKLSCTVTDCITNASGCCCRPSIEVEGPTAQCVDQTVCHSYQKRTAAAENSAHCCTPNQSLDICCTVHACGYNKQDKCQSNSVAIACGGSGSECTTFKK